MPLCADDATTEGSSRDSGAAAGKRALPDLDDLVIPDVPELVIGFARPLGTNTHDIRITLEGELRRTAFITESISVAELLDSLSERLEPKVSSETASQRYDRLMRFGDLLRHTRGPDAAANLVIAEIAARRSKAQARARECNANGVAYLVRNLMHPAEVSQLRNIYKQRFFLLGVFGDALDRRNQLVRELAEGGDTEAEAEHNAERLADIDAGTQPSSIHISEGALAVDKTFHMADVFLSLSSSAGGSEHAEDTLRRFVDQMFRNPFGTPTTEEMGMAYAFLASCRSGSLARQVGAAILDAQGCLLGVGWNDAPQPGGGLYPECSDNDPDPSDWYRLDSIHYFLTTLLAADTWSGDVASESLPQEERAWWLAFHEATKTLPPLKRSHIISLVSERAISPTRLVNLIEFGRCVHAELAALTDAARRGISVQDAVLYVTTFPCHECTRNIVAAGIDRVVYVEPYGKSLATKLYNKRSVDFHTGPPGRKLADDRMHFVPFVGIAPRCFEILFDWIDRKPPLRKLLETPDQQAGSKVEWNRGEDGRLRAPVLGYRLNPQTDPSAKVDPLFEVAYALAEWGVVRRVDEQNAEWSSVIDAK